MNRFTWIASLLTRISIGWMFAQTGWGKVHNLPRIIEYFGSLGIPSPHLMAPFVSFVELICGTLLILGLLTRLSAIPLIVTMVVATVTAQASQISNAGDLFGLAEYLIALALFWLVIVGPGWLSLDAVIVKFRKP